MADLIAELVELTDKFRHDDNLTGEESQALAHRIDAVHAEIAAAVRDKRRMDFIEQKAAEGWCPGIINDDNGHWAWSDSGIQPVPDGDDPQTMATTFFVEADQWKPTLREAIDAVMDDDTAMRAGEGEG